MKKGEEILKVMKNDLYTANERIKELEEALIDILDVRATECGTSDIVMRNIANKALSGVKNAR